MWVRGRENHILDHMNGEMCKRCLNAVPGRACMLKMQRGRVQRAAPKSPLPGSHCPGCDSEEATTAESLTGIIA